MPIHAVGKHLVTSCKAVKGLMDGCFPSSGEREKARGSRLLPSMPPAVLPPSPQSLRAGDGASGGLRGGVCSAGGKLWPAVCGLHGVPQPHSFSGVCAQGWNRGQEAEGVCTLIKPFFSPSPQQWLPVSQRGREVEGPGWFADASSSLRCGCAKGRPRGWRRENPPGSLSGPRPSEGGPTDSRLSSPASFYPFSQPIAEEHRMEQEGHPGGKRRPCVICRSL